MSLEDKTLEEQVVERATELAWSQRFLALAQSLVEQADFEFSDGIPDQDTGRALLNTAQRIETAVAVRLCPFLGPEVKAANNDRSRKPVAVAAE